MTKFDLDTLKSLCKSMFDHWRKAENTDTNRVQNNCILFSTSFSLSNGPLSFCLIYLESFNVHGYLLPTSINIMIIQTTKGTCASYFIYLMWIFTMFIIIKSNLIKGKFIPWTFTFVAFLRRWIWWGNGSLQNTNNAFNDFRAFNILLFSFLNSCMLMSTYL